VRSARTKPVALAVSAMTIIHMTLLGCIVLVFAPLIFFDILYGIEYANRPDVVGSD
jgi:hypothetical protein